MILVDNSYIGHRISSARKTAKVRRNDAARMLRITPKKLLRYESLNSYWNDCSITHGQ